MIVGVPREVIPGETRVGLVPETLEKLKKLSVDILVESGAGAASLNSDASYLNAGARIASGAEELYANSDLVVKVQPFVFRLLF